MTETNPALRKQFELPKWEYDRIPFNPTLNYVAHFNNKGGEGWELIYIDFEKCVALFKRQK